MQPFNLSSYFYETHYYIIQPSEKNQGSTEPSTQVKLGYDTLKCQKNITTHITWQKLPPSVKDCLYFQTD